MRCLAESDSGQSKILLLLVVILRKSPSVAKVPEQAL
jgi:hypothetical protein